MIPDYRKDATIVYRFTTRDAEGEPTTLSGPPTIAVYKEGSTSEVTTGLTLTADYDGVTGLNQIAIVTTDAFYEPDKDYAVVLTAGTVDGVAVAGEVAHQFSLEKQTIADVSGLSTLDAAGVRTAVGLNAANLDTQLSDIDDAAVGAESAASAAAADAATLAGRLTATRAGYIDKLDVSGTLAHSDAANTYKADVSGLSTHSAADVWNVDQTDVTNVDGVGSGIGTRFDTVDGELTTLLSRITTTWTNAVTSMYTAFNDMVEDVTGWRFKTKALEQGPTDGGLDAAGVRAALGFSAASYDTDHTAVLNAIAAIDVGDASGDYTLTVTVEDDDQNPIENARVTTILNGALFAFGLTDSSGERELPANAATYTVVVTAGGFIAEVQQHTVTAAAGTHGLTVTLDAITLTASDPDKSTVYFTVFENGEPEAGVKVEMYLVSTPVVGGHSPDPWEATSDSEGLVEFTNVLRNSQYRLRTNRWVNDVVITVPDEPVWEIDQAFFTKAYRN